MHPTAVRPRAGRGFAPTPTDPGVVLIVTNDSDLREVAARVLGSEGFHVLTAPHAGHAVLACMQADRVDAAVIEISMDDVSGPALAERLRRHYPDMRAVYVARQGTTQCEGVLVRPFTRGDLLAELALALTPASAY